MAVLILALEDRGVEVCPYKRKHQGMDPFGIIE
jgi:hypothetical protein